MGEPYFVDLSAPGFPVFTAMHGMDFWDADPVSPSLAAFLRR